MAASAAPTAHPALPRRPGPARDGFPKGSAGPRPRTGWAQLSNACFRLSRTIGEAPAQILPGAHDAGTGYCRSGCPYIGEERMNFVAQNVGLAAKGIGCLEHLAGRRPGLRRRRADADDVAGHLAGAARGVLDVAGDLARRSPLLFDRGRNGGSHLIELADGLADVPYG